MNREMLFKIHRELREQRDRCLDFWLKNGLDREHGGVYTCLDRRGKVFSTDKSVWMQGRCGWLFAWLCTVYGRRPEWMDAAKSCLNFMEAHCVNPKAQGRMYFTVTAQGQPLRQRRYYFSEAFHAMANAQFYGLTGEKSCLDRALRSYDLYWNLWHGAKDPAGLGPKTDPGTRIGRAFGIPMIFLNVTSVFLQADPAHRQRYEGHAQACVEDILQFHVHPELQCVLENVGPRGEARLEVSEGRIVNPGHDLEGVWFLLLYAQRTNRPALVEQAEEIFRWAVNRGWDPEFGGLWYFVDALGLPPEQCEHDMKLWWPQCELLISSLMLYRATRKEAYFSWFLKALDYCRAHFFDPEYGEWYGYLRRDGVPTQPPAKGTTFKGPFHLPRMLVMAEAMLTDLLDGRPWVPEIAHPAQKPLENHGEE